MLLGVLFAQSQRILIKIPSQPVANSGVRALIRNPGETTNSKGRAQHIYPKIKRANKKEIVRFTGPFPVSTMVGVFEGPFTQEGCAFAEQQNGLHSICSCLVGCRYQAVLSATACRVILTSV